MQSLLLDPPCPHLLPRDRSIRVALIGCGGTGSHIAQSLARIAAHVRASGLPALELVFVDGDTVEAKNVGRQLFSPIEIGRNKAQTLAARFSAALGLPIRAIPTMLTDDGWNDLGLRHDEIGVLVGAVDSAAGRTLLARMLRRNWTYWLDCGNHESSGQVAIGNATAAEKLKTAFALPGVCAALPSPDLVYPDLLAERAKRRRDDCAAQQEDNIQSLMVNQAMAAVAGEYLYNLIVRRRLTVFATSIDLESLSMRSQPITARAIAQACGLDESFFSKQQKKRAA